MPESKMTETSSNFLHFLRAIASQIVVVGHILALNHLVSNSVMSFLPGFSVMIFLVISGYIISYTSDAKGKKYGLFNYLVDRFSRIYVALIPALLLTLVLGIICFNYIKTSAFDLNLKHLVCTVLMQQENPLLLQFQYMLPNTENYNFIGIFGPNIPLWSLSIEWWLYMFFGLVYFKGIDEFKMKHYVLLFCSLPFVIGYMFLQGRAGYGLTFIWFSGVIVNHLTNKTLNIKASHLLFFIFLIFTLISIKTVPNISIIFFIVFFFFAIKHFNRLGNNNIYNTLFKSAKWPGNYSYSIYIIHYPIVFILSSLNLNPVSKVVLCFVIANFLALIFYLLFERHHKLINTKIKKLFNPI